MQIAWIGTGVMGSAMVGRLLKNHFQVNVYSRTKEKANTVIQEGAVWHDCIASCVKNADVIITMVGYPRDVRDVYLGETGILAQAKEGAIAIDMTTTSPKLSQELYKIGKENGIDVLDAPVSGGDVGAKNGTLSIMVGGDQEVFEMCMPIFEVLGSTIHHTGAAGSGQHTKMANQIAIAGAVSGMCEALAYAKAVGLDPQNMLDCICSGAAGSWQISNMAPRVLAGDLEPGFYVKHYIKDMRIAVEESQQREKTLPILETVLSQYEQLQAKGLGEKGTQALITFYE